MSADLLREAAAKMRLENMAVRRPYGRDEMFRSAVADLLDEVADAIGPHRMSPTESGPVVQRVLAVARAYLGSDQ